MGSCDWWPNTVVLSVLMLARGVSSTAGPVSVRVFIVFPLGGRRRYVMNESKLRPESVTVGASCRMAIGAVVNGRVTNVAVPPLSGMTPPIQLAGLLQLPPVVPTSTPHVPLVWAAARVAGRMMPAKADDAIRTAWCLRRRGKRIFSLPVGSLNTRAWPAMYP